MTLHTGLELLGLVHAHEARAERGHLLQDLLEGSNQVVHHDSGVVRLHNHAEHGLLRRRIREEGLGLLVVGVVVTHPVARHVPMVLLHLVLQVDVIEGQRQFRVQHRRHHRQTLGVAVIEHHEIRSAILAVEALEGITQVFGVAELVVAQGAVAREPEAVELVVLDEDATGGAREVQGVGVRLAAQVRDRDGDVLAQALALAPDDPASATDALSELVAGG
mmetsp:Transcript_39954/g.103397  ORF Transcript_39954/g.103397 Transcript_39954/m.103397 type:complete len:220 (-) Transcript_39954:973-1632(-)